MRYLVQLIVDQRKQIVGGVAVSLAMRLEHLGEGVFSVHATAM